MEGKDKAWNIEDLLDEATLAKIEEDILRTGKVTTIGGFDFKCTCFACPEQYDAFLDGQYAAFEIKLSDGSIGSAVKSLIKFYENVEKKPAYMCVIVGHLDTVMRDPETGVFIVPVTSLRP